MIYVSQALQGYKYVSTSAPWFRSTPYLEIDLQNFYEFMIEILLFVAVYKTSFKIIQFKYILIIQKIY